nr:ribonuclease H-like domain-containing protein [Tanacetum cinerariifolium]
MFVHGYTNDEYQAEDQPILISKLDMSCPLHLHPNDSAAFTIVSIKLKDSGTGDVLPNIRNGYAIIFSEESHRVLSSSSSGFGTSQRPSNVTRPSASGNRRPPNGSPLVCENYRFNGYTIDRCFKIVGYPHDFEKKTGSNNNQNGQNFNRIFVNNNSIASSSPSSSTFSNKQITKLISLIKENSRNNGEKGVHANIACTVFNKNFGRFFCNNNQLHDALVATGLIVDSGAN